MKLGRLQVFWIIATMELGMTLLMTMSSSFEAARRDAWISMIVAGCIAALIAWTAAKLSMLYPNQTLVQISETIMGKWLGKLIVILYVVQWYTIIPIVLCQFSDLITTLLLPETPKLPIILTMVMLAIYVTYSGGIEGIGRCSEILGPIIIMMIFLVLAANLPNIQIRKIMPIYTDSGLLSIMKGSLAPASYLGHAVEFIMLTPFLQHPRKAAALLKWAVIVPVIIVVLSTIMVTITIGPNIAMETWYSFFELTREVSIGGFVENVDAMVIVIWVASVFIKISTYLFIASYGTAQFLKVKEWKHMVWFIAPFMVVFSTFPDDIVEATNHYLLNFWIPIVLPVHMIGLPLLMLVLGKIRRQTRLV